MVMGVDIDAGPPPCGETAVRALDLCKQIDGRPVLRDVSIDIPEGRFVAVLGANGAGKSTLLKVLATLVRPTSGELEIFGRRVRGDAGPLRPGSDSSGTRACSTVNYRPALTSSSSAAFTACLSRPSGPCTSLRWSAFRIGPTMP